MERIFKIGEKTHTVHLGPAAASMKATVDGQDLEFEASQIGDHEFVFRRGGRQTRLFLAQGRGGETWVHFAGRLFKLLPVDRDYGDGGDEAVSSGRLLASMPGRVIKVLAEAGQEMAENQAVLVMESMKMEITLTSPFHGKVEEVNVKPGQQVDAGAVLVKIEPIGPG